MTTTTATMTQVLTVISEHATTTQHSELLFDFTVTTGRIGSQVMPVIRIQAIIGEIRDNTYFPWEAAFKLSKLRMELQELSNEKQENNSNDISYYNVLFMFDNFFVEIEEEIEIH